MVDQDQVSSGIENVRASDDGWRHFIPRQYTRTGGEPILVALAGPRCFLATFRYIPPDQGLSVSRTLIRASGISDALEQNERAANKKQSDVHDKIIRPRPAKDNHVAMIYGKQTRKFLPREGKASVESSLEKSPLPPRHTESIEMHGDKAS